MAALELAEIEATLTRLAAVEHRLDEMVGPRLTLDPARDRATSLPELARALLPCAERLPDGTFGALALGLEDTAMAIAQHFPGNLFWDFDALAASLLRNAEGPEALNDAFALVVELHRVFGGSTTIRFRYVHDFIFGFDWAKWVRRDPTERRDIGPFDLRLLTALRVRGDELFALIEADDAEYPQLRDDRARNAFGFSREPDQERVLHRALAAEGLIPVEAWRLDPTPHWDRPFADLRAARANAI